MIYTVTFNPAVDYVIRMDRMTAGRVNRTKEEAVYFGGKGINVSIVLKMLDTPSVALGFVAGFTGEAIENGVRHMGIQTDFVHLREGFSRINVKIRSDEETELNGSGPAIPEEKLAELFEKLNTLQDGDTLILAGSIPASLPQDVYERILDRLSNKALRIVVDATGALLLKVLKYHPFLIKPNNHELSELFGVPLQTSEEIAQYAKKLQEMGARNVLVSMAGDGALLLDEYGVQHKIAACRGEVKNSVGAGDSMVAGFVAECEKTGPNGKIDYASALRLGTAAGGATAFSEGLCTREMVETLRKTL